MKEIEPRVIRRDEFGPGRLGEMAYQTILSGVPCETIIEEEEKSICERISDRTVDFDAMGQADFVPVCSEVHESMTRARITRDTKRLGRPTVLSKNGFGRA